MIELDAVWGVPRSVMVNGRSARVPFGIDLGTDLVDFLKRWLRYSGTSFSVKRMKSLKIWALHILAGEKDFTVTWFRWKRYKTFKIPKLRLFEYFVDHLHDLKAISKVLAVLNSYKLVIVDEPSLKAITECERSENTEAYIPHLRRYVNLPRVPPMVLERTESVNTRTKWCDDWGGTHSGPIGLRDDQLPAELALVFDDQNRNPYCLGKVVPIRDKGKFRNILVGHWALQLQTKKLADWLRSWLWSQPEIASGDQSRMSKFCIESLKCDRYMLSIDLSEATDRLSREFQINLLTSMGVPRRFFSFLDLPFYYQGECFGEERGLKKGRYRNGQPMGLYVSFPMFELAHYVILKFVTAGSTADFRICGDDVVIACCEKDGDRLFSRYENLVRRLGGVISYHKTLRSSRFAEGVGAIFLKDIPKEIRIPSGKLSPLEAYSPITWLYQKIVAQTPLARAISYCWLSTSLTKRYTYEQRRAANEFMVTQDLSDWRVEALRQLDKPHHMPLEYDRWDDEFYSFWRNTPEENKDSTFRYISPRKYRDALVSNKIVHLYERDHSVE